MQYSLTALQSAAYKMTIKSNQHLSKPVCVLYGHFYCRAAALDSNRFYQVSLINRQQCVCLCVLYSIICVLCSHLFDFVVVSITQCIQYLIQKSNYQKQKAHIEYKCTIFQADTLRCSDSSKNTTTDTWPRSELPLSGSLPQLPSHVYQKYSLS